MATGDLVYNNPLSGLLDAVLGTNVDKDTNTTQDTTTATTGSQSGSQSGTSATTGSNASTATTTGATTANTSQTGATTGTSATTGSNTSKVDTTGSNTNKSDTTGSSASTTTATGTTSNTGTSSTSGKSSTDSTTTGNTTAHSGTKTANNTTGSSDTTSATTGSTTGTSSQNTSSSATTDSSTKTTGTESTTTTGVDKSVTSADIAGLKEVLSRQMAGIGPDQIAAIFREGLKSSAAGANAFGNALGARTSNNGPLADLLAQIQSKSVIDVMKENNALLNAASGTAGKIGDLTKTVDNTKSEQSTVVKDLLSVLTGTTNTTGSSTGTNTSTNTSNTVGHTNQDTASTGTSETESVTDQLVKAITSGLTSQDTVTANTGTSSNTSNTSGTNTSSTSGSGTNTSSTAQSGTNTSNTATTGTNTANTVQTGTNASTVAQSGTNSQNVATTQNSNLNTTQNTAQKIVGTENVDQNVAKNINGDMLKSAVGVIAAGGGISALFNALKTKGFVGTIQDALAWAKGLGVDDKLDQWKLNTDGTPFQTDSGDPYNSVDTIDDGSFTGGTNDQGVSDTDTNLDTGDLLDGIDTDGMADGGPIEFTETIFDKKKDENNGIGLLGLLSQFGISNDSSPTSTAWNAPPETPTTMAAKKVIEAPAQKLDLTKMKILPTKQVDYHGGDAESWQTSDAPMEVGALMPEYKRIQTGSGDNFQEEETSEIRGYNRFMGMDGEYRITDYYDADGNFSFRDRTKADFMDKYIDTIIPAIASIFAPGIMLPINLGNAVESGNILGAVSSAVGFIPGVDPSVVTAIRTANGITNAYKGFSSGNILQGIGGATGAIKGGVKLVGDGAADGGLIAEDETYTHELAEAMGMTKEDDGSVRFSGPSLALLRSSLKPPGFADGGVIKGPGTGTSDDVPARGPDGRRIQLSNNEFIIPADVVQKLGPQFFHSLIAQFHTPAAVQEAMK